MLRRVLSFNSGINHRLLLSMVFPLFLLAGRVCYTGSVIYLFLVWNLFLAALPCFISYCILHGANGMYNRRLTIVCLLFLPNAPYIITDLFHLRLAGPSWLWFDTLLIMSFAWSGILLFCQSLSNLEEALGSRLGRWQQLMLLLVLCLLCGFGIYLGRYLRFNSWDLLSNPQALVTEIGQRLLFPAAHPRTWGITLAYGAFLFLSHLSLNPADYQVLKKK